MIESTSVQHFEGACHVGSMTELEAVLTKRGRNGTANEFWLRHGEEDYPAMAIMVNGSAAVVHYFPEADHAGFVSIGSLGDSDDLTDSRTFFMTETQSINIGSHLVIQDSSALNAAREFAETSCRPRCINWIEL